MATYEPQKPSFLATSVDLKKLLKATSKEQKTAVDTLVRLCASTDEAVALKAARSLIEFQIQAAKEISDDQLKRLIAEMKVANNPQTLAPVRDNKVEVVFDRLIEVPSG